MNKIKRYLLLLSFAAVGIRAHDLPMAYRVIKTPGIEYISVFSPIKGEALLITSRLDVKKLNLTTFEIEDVITDKGFSKWRGVFCFNKNQVLYGQPRNIKNTLDFYSLDSKSVLSSIVFPDDVVYGLCDFISPNDSHVILCDFTIQDNNKFIVYKNIKGTFELVLEHRFSQNIPRKGPPTDEPKCIFSADGSACAIKIGSNLAIVELTTYSVIADCIFEENVDRLEDLDFQQNRLILVSSLERFAWRYKNDALPFSDGSYVDSSIVRKYLAVNGDVYTLHIDNSDNNILLRIVQEVNGKKMLRLKSPWIKSWGGPCLDSANDYFFILGKDGELHLINKYGVQSSPKK